MTTMLTAPSLRLRLWRDHDEELLAAPGIEMGEWVDEPGTDLVAAAERLYRDGARRVALEQPIDLTGDLPAATLIRAMVLLRELTSWAIAIDWTPVFGEHTEVWRRLNHIYPPRQLPDHPDADEVLADWRDTFYLCKCVYRQGPGFVQVRDRRSGLLARFTIDDPDYLAAIGTLLPGAAASDVPAAVLDAFIAEGLAGTAGDLAWWLPYRVRRWPYPSMIV
jgi:hypothetical protein